MTRYPDIVPTRTRGLPARSRQSACATEARQRELERLRRMSVEARIVAALTIGARFAWLRPCAAATTV